MCARLNCCTNPKGTFWLMFSISHSYELFAFVWYGNKLMNSTNAHLLLLQCLYKTRIMNIIWSLKEYVSIYFWFELWLFLCNKNLNVFGNFWNRSLYLIVNLDKKIPLICHLVRRQEKIKCISKPRRLYCCIL